MLNVIILIPNVKILRWLLTAALLLGLASFSYSMSRPPSTPVPMEFVRVVYEQDAKAIVIEWIVPDIDSIADIGHIELLISHADSRAQFGVMLNLSDYCNPIPPGNFGVIIDPGSDDRSIKNVSSPGGQGRFDHTSPHGILLKQSTSGVVNGNLGISIWVVPQDWNPGRHIIKTRAGQRKHIPTSWQTLAEFDYSGAGVEKVTQYGCLIKPIFLNVSNQETISFEYLRSITLIRYERRKQDEGVVIKRWAGDTSGQYKDVEKERRDLKSSDFSGGLILLEPGIYQFKHNSVSGKPPSGFYGESNFFEIKMGEEIMDVEILLYPAI